MHLVAERAISLFRPPPVLTVSEWADANRFLSRGSSAEWGNFVTDRLPYMRAMMDSICDPKCGNVVFQCAAQVGGKTESMLNAMLYLIDHDPCSILVKYPSLDSARKFSQKKFTRGVNDTKCIRDKIAPNRTRDSGNTIFSKEFPGGSITFIGANSPSGTRALSCRAVFQDEIDSDRPNAEGDPIEQADTRAENFYNRILVKASTPTIKGMSRIESEFETSTQEKWNVPCPKCVHWQSLRWPNLKWTWEVDGKKISDPARACYVCENCKAEWSDYERIRAIQSGKWMALFPHRHKRGFHLSGLYKIMGKRPDVKSYMHGFVLDFLDAVAGGQDKLQVWTNTFLAETWQAHHMIEKETAPLMLRREAYGPELPAKVLLLVLACDTQGDRLEYEITGWGLGEECWGIEYGILEGSPHRAEVWLKLEMLMERKWSHPSGRSLWPAIVVIDSGGQSQNESFSVPVYSFCRKHRPTAQNPHKKVFPVKGSPSHVGPLVAEREQKLARVNLLVVNTDICKATVYDRIDITVTGPRCFHFPDAPGYGEAYFKGLTAEEVRYEKKDGFTVRRWIKKESRNEPLDIRAYAIAALEKLRPNWTALAENYRVPESAQTSPTPAPEIIPATTTRTYALAIPPRRRLPFRRH